MSFNIILEQMVMLFNGRDETLMAQGTFVTTLLSVLSIPLVYAVMQMG